MMTREDMLRELELLPIWRLRVPLPAPAEVGQVVLPEKITPVEQVTEVETEIQIALAHAEDAFDSLDLIPQIFTHIASEDGDWLFVLPNISLQADEELLLQNICKAIRIKAKPLETTSNIVDVIKTTPPKMMIAMGEATAQAMMQSADSLSSLRGRIHQFEGASLVVTYDLAHLLQNLPDKAKAWDDLCLAMQTLQRL